MFRGKSVVKAVGIIALVALSQACSLTIPIEDPGVSQKPYTVKPAEQKDGRFDFSSALPSSHNPSSGRITIHLKSDGNDLDAAKFVATNLQQEMQARGISFEFTHATDDKFVLKTFDVLSHRVSSFSPLVTISSASLDVTTPKGTQRIAAMVKRAKMPTMVMSEVNDPCFSVPLELVVKELAAKINHYYFGYALSDADVEALTSKIRSEADQSATSFLDVYELGFSNNPKAVAALVEFSRHGSEYVRFAAIAGLGTLGAEDQFEYLKTVYSDNKTWQDRGAALKSIGDLGTPVALEFLRQQRQRWKDRTDDEAVWNSRIIALYLN
jgi:hypothetical protein